MINQVPSHLSHCLTSPFKLVGDVKRDSSIWYHTVENNSLKSKLEIQLQVSTVVGCNNKSNTICLYNPITKSCYSSTACKLDEGYSPFTNFPSQIPF